jgi:hypothetical protein
VLIAHAGFIRALRVLMSESSWEDALGAEVPHLEWIPIGLPSRIGG